MSRSIRLSDELFEEAKKKGDVFHRSPPQQIEHWAKIGRVMERVLSYSVNERVKAWGSERDIDDLLNEVVSEEGRHKARMTIARSSGEHRYARDPEKVARVRKTD